MSELAVVTMTNGRRPEWLALCVDSVRRNLPPGAVHVIVDCPSLAEFAKTKLSTLKLAKYIAFVDDDDLVINDSIRRCLEAVKEEKVAVAFTDEVTVDVNGKVTDPQPLRRGLRYTDVVLSVRTIHHLAVLETARVHHQVPQLVRNMDALSGLDWLMVASAALQGSAVHVPIQGYQWRIHPQNQHQEQCREFRQNSKIFRAFLQTQVGEKTLIKRLAE
jgi:hypothetical protein